MSYAFSGTNQYLAYGGAILTGVPISFAGWFNSSSNSLAQCVASITNTGGTAPYFSLQLRGDLSGDILRVSVGDGSATGSADTSSGYTINTWQHAAGVFSTNSARAVYLNGASKGTNTTATNPSTTLDSTNIGALIRSSTIQLMVGRLAEVGIWNIALSDQEVAALAAGVPPWKVQAVSLVGYWPLYGYNGSPEIDYAKVPHLMTVTNATVGTDHAPLSFWIPDRFEPPQDRLSGTSVEVLDEATEAASGKLIFSGTSAQTLDEASEALLGSLKFIGSSSEVSDEATQSLSGSQIFSGTSLETLDEATQSLSGALIFSGTLSQSQDEATQEAAGLLSFISSGASLSDEARQELSASLAFLGSAVNALDETTQSLSGSIVNVSGPSFDTHDGDKTSTIKRLNKEAKEPSLEQETSIVIATEHSKLKAQYEEYTARATVLTKEVSALEASLKRSSDREDEIAKTSGALGRLKVQQERAQALAEILKAKIEEEELLVLLLLET